MSAFAQSSAAHSASPTAQAQREFAERRASMKARLLADRAHQQHGAVDEVLDEVLDEELEEVDGDEQAAASSGPVTTAAVPPQLMLKSGKPSVALSGSVVTSQSATAQWREHRRQTISRPQMTKHLKARSQSTPPMHALKATLPPQPHVSVAHLAAGGGGAGVRAASVPHTASAAPALQQLPKASVGAGAKGAAFLAFGLVGVAAMGMSTQPGQRQTQVPAGAGVRFPGTQAPTAPSTTAHSTSPPPAAPTSNSPSAGPSVTAKQPLWLQRSR